MSRGTDAGLSGGAITLACARQSGVSGTEYASQFTMRALYSSLRDGISFGGAPHDDSLVLCPAYGRHLIGALHFVVIGAEPLNYQQSLPQELSKYRCTESAPRFRLAVMASPLLYVKHVWVRTRKPEHYESPRNNTKR